MCQAASVVVPIKEGEAVVVSQANSPADFYVQVSTVESVVK